LKYTVTNRHSNSTRMRLADGSSSLFKVGVPVEVDEASAALIKTYDLTIRGLIKVEAVQEKKSSREAPAVEAKPSVNAVVAPEAKDAPQDADATATPEPPTATEAPKQTTVRRRKRIKTSDDE
jgi:hypothetical protein